MLNPEDLDISIERENELREKYLKYDLNETIDESLLNEYLIQNEWFHLYIILYPVILNYVF